MGKNNRQNREKKKAKKVQKQFDKTEKRRLRGDSHPESEGATIDQIMQVARSVSSGPLGWIDHRPNPGAKAHECYNNAQDMTNQAGGRVMPGWSFHLRFRPGVGSYLFTTPHAVWVPPDGDAPVDVTPYPEPFHAPVMDNGRVLFLGDLDADIVPIADGIYLSPPLRAFAIGGSPALAKYVAERNEKFTGDFESEKRAALARAGR
ncbi:hypothetical protein [Myxococcus vastator]|uniref:hypothetical protein n=1 Tax=Myxococcus vastator TaxID=2709664 RepID=UPI0013D80ADD|nr:hypothetical protein [Myxococcus vastator]